MLKALDFLQEAWLPKDMLKALDFLQEAWLPTDMLKALDFLQEAWLPKNDTPPISDGTNRDQVICAGALPVAEGREGIPWIPLTRAICMNSEAVTAVVERLH